jgi:hypothetical protein
MNSCIGQRRTHAWGLAVSATGQTGQSEAIHSAAGVLRTLPKIKPAALASVPSASSAQLMPIRSKKVLNSARHMVVDATDGTDDIFRTRAQTLIILVPRRPSREKVISKISVRRERLRPPQAQPFRRQLWAQRGSTGCGNRRPPGLA